MPEGMLCFQGAGGQEPAEGTGRAQARLGHFLSHSSLMTAAGGGCVAGWALP